MTTLVVALQILALIAWGAFLVTFTVRTSWWRSDLGRNVAASSAVIIGLLALIVLQVQFPDYVLRQYLQVLVYSAAVVAGVQRTRKMLDVQSMQPPTDWKKH